MAHISIHDVEYIKIEKYQLDSGVWVCKITCNCITSISKSESYEEITLFSENKITFNNLEES